MFSLEAALKRLIKEKGITMTDVINSVGMSQAGFYKMLNSNSVKVETLEKIAAFFNVDISYFFVDPSNRSFWIPPPPPSPENISLIVDSIAPKEKVIYKEIDAAKYINNLVQINLVNVALFDLYSYVQESLKDVEKHKNATITMDGETTTLGQLFEGLMDKVNQVNEIGRNLE